MIDPASRGIQAALDQVNAMLAREGGKLTLVERQGSTLLVRYAAPAPADCPTCAIDGDAAVMLLRGALARQAPAVTTVRLAS